MRHYIALIHKDADSEYGVSFPDVPGCITAGSTIDEARRMAGEALSFHLNGMAEDGEPWPATSSLDVIMEERENQDAVAFLVAVEDPEPKVVRVNITIPEDVLAEIDRHAERHGSTRSGFLASAAKAAIASASKGARLTPKGRKAQKAAARR